jgi:hypothetical protein
LERRFDIRTGTGDSDIPGGDLTDHGADPAERAQDDAGQTGGQDGPAGADVPAGELTDHGVDPTGRLGG